VSTYQHLNFQPLNQTSPATVQLPGAPGKFKLMNNRKVKRKKICKFVAHYIEKRK